MSGDVVSAYTVTTEEFPNLFGEIIDKDEYLPEQVFNVRINTFIVEKNA
jgi:hypothetical protein